MRVICGGDGGTIFAATEWEWPARTETTIEHTTENAATSQYRM